MQEDELPGNSDKAREATQMVGFQMRLRESLRSELERHAAAGGRSLNGEVIARLERSLETDRLLGDPETQALFIDIARQMMVAEAITGKRWHKDPATYWAARSLVDAALARAKPIPPNFASVNALEAERAELEPRREVLRRFLTECRAITLSQNALASLLSPSAPPAIYERPVEEWRNSEQPDGRLEADEIEFIRERIAELREIEARLPALLAERAELLKPWFDARTQGQAIVASLNAPTEPDTLEAA